MSEKHSLLEELIEYSRLHARQLRDNSRDYARFRGQNLANSGDGYLAMKTASLKPTGQARR